MRRAPRRPASLLVGRRRAGAAFLVAAGFLAADFWAAVFWAAVFLAGVPFLAGLAFLAGAAFLPAALAALGAFLAGPVGGVSSGAVTRAS